MNTSAEKQFEYLRVPIRNVTTSHGNGTQFILDYDDDNATYWEGSADQSRHWVLFDLGEPRPVSRVFLVSGMAGWKARLPRSVEWSSRSNLDGRLADFVWQHSDDGKTWTDIPETERKNSDSFREIFQMIKAVGRPVYGSQFHPEIAKPFSCSKAILMNFLAMAVERAKKQGAWISE
jgi:hypothetical protein